MTEKSNYNKNIWLDPNFYFPDVVKIVRAARMYEDSGCKKALYDCFLEDLNEIPSKQRKKILCSLKYYDFLKTPYWHMVSDKVKYEKDMVCEICGKRFNKTQFLDVHHKDYSIHGEEHLHLDKLACLCDFCHKNIHNIV